MKQRLNTSQVLELLKRLQSGRTARAFAESLGISPQYLSDVYLGRRDPGPEILAKIGLTREWSYRPKQS